MNESPKRKRKTATAPDRTTTKDEPGHNHTSTLARTATVELNASPTTLTNTPAPLTARAVAPDISPSGSQDNSPESGEIVPVLNESFETSSLSTGQTDQATTQRIESLERAVRDLIQYVEANNRVSQPNGQGGGGWQETVNNVTGFLNKLLGSDQPTGENSLVQGFMQRMMDTTFGHYATLDAVLAKQYGLPPPVQHMIIKQ